MAGWYDTMKRRWGYNNISENKEINQEGNTAPFTQQHATQQPEVQTPDNHVKEPTNQTTSDTPQLSEAGWFNDFYQKNMVAPITPEEEQRRIRGAQAAQSIGHLGNVLSSFSNLVFTDKGAPSQTLPNVPDLNINTFEDRIAEKRRQYIAGQMSAREQDRKSLLDQIKLQLEQKDDERKEKLNNARIEELKSSDALNKEKEEYQRLVNEGYPEKVAADIAYRKALSEKAYNEGRAAIIRAQNSGKGESGNGNNSSNKPKNKYRIEGPNGNTRYYDLDKDKDVVELYRLAVKNHLIAVDNAKTINQMKEAIKVNMYKYIPGDSYNLSDGWSSSDYKEQPKKEQPKLILK